jgi:hypothetical protein
VADRPLKPKQRDLKRAHTECDDVTAALVGQADSETVALCWVCDDITSLRLRPDTIPGEFEIRELTLLTTPASLESAALPAK